MIYVRGRLPYGRVERVAGSNVLTTFSHFWFLPIVPRGSYVVSAAEPAGKEVPIGTHLVSVLAAYARVWGSIWLVCCVIAIANGSRELVLGRSIWLELGVVASLVVWGFLIAGRLSRRTAAQRLVYSKFVGMPVDVARFSRAQAKDLRERLEAILVEEGRGLASTYRSDSDPRRRWREIGADGETHDAAFLEAALTRARLELPWAANRAERTALSEAHERIWGKLERAARRDHAAT